MAEPFAPPGSETYRRAIAASNSAARQEPAFAAAPTTPAEAAACVRLARTRGLTVVPQATGHGAAGHLGSDVLLIDTSGLDTIRIDAADRSAVVGAGCRWDAVNTAAIKHGLLGRAGSAPDVGIAGYTFGAGAGWLVRPWGLASSALHAVTYVDGYGTLRVARDDTTDQLDRDVIWASRGGGGVGLAVSLKFGLVPVQDLWAGYLIWPVDALGDVTRAWTASLGGIGAALSSCLAVLQAPPTPAVPAALHGTANASFTCRWLRPPVTRTPRPYEKRCVLHRRLPLTRGDCPTSTGSPRSTSTRIVPCPRWAEPAGSEP